MRPPFVVESNNHLMNKLLVPLIGTALMISVAAVAKSYNATSTRHIVLSADIQDSDLKTVQSDILLMRSDSMIDIGAFLQSPKSKLEGQSYYSASLHIAPKQQCYVNLYSHKHTDNGSMRITTERLDDACNLEQTNSYSWKVKAQLEIPANGL